MISVHYTTFCRAFADVDANIIQTEVCAVQVEILTYTSRCEMATMVSKLHCLKLNYKFASELNIKHSSLLHWKICMLIWLKPRYVQAKSRYWCTHHNAFEPVSVQIHVVYNLF